MSPTARVTAPAPRRTASRSFGSILLVAALTVHASSSAAAGCCRLTFEGFQAFPDAGRASDAAMSPDGRHIYQALTPDVQSQTDAAGNSVNVRVGGGLRVLEVNAKTGRVKIRQMIDTLEASLEFPYAGSVDFGHVQISPDGRHVYAGTNGLLAVYVRDPKRGTLQFVQRISGPQVARAIALDPLGLHLYAAGWHGDLVAFARNRQTGALTEVQRLADVPSMDNITDMLVSPDGDNLYVASDFHGNSIVTFDRDPMTGLVDNHRAIVDVDQVIDGLANPRSLLFDESGEHLYVLSRGESSLGHYARDPANGNLMFESAYHGRGESEPALSSPGDMAMTPDGRTVMVFSKDAIFTLRRDPVSGHLAFIESLRDGEAGLDLELPNDGYIRSFVMDPSGQRAYYLAGHGIGSFEDQGFVATPRLFTAGPGIFDGDPLPGGGTFEELSSPSAIAVSPDGRHAYISNANQVSSLADTLVVLDIDPQSGEMTPVTSYSDASNPPDDIGLHNIQQLRFSRDGRFLYAVAYLYPFDNYFSSLTVFERDASDGTLTVVQKLEHETDGYEGLWGSRMMRFGPDEKTLYVVGMRPEIASLSFVDVFARDRTTGRLEPLQVVRNFQGPVSITNPHDIAFTPDGKFAYLGAGGRYALDAHSEDALTVFKRDRDGRLSHLMTVDTGDDIIQLNTLAMSPDGKHLYGLQNLGWAASRLIAFRLDRRSGEPTLLYTHRDGIAGLKHITGASTSVRLQVLAGGKQIRVTSAGYTGQHYRFGVSLLARDRKSGMLRAIGSQTSDDGTGEFASLGDYAVDEARGVVYVLDRNQDGVHNVRLTRGPVLTYPHPGARLAGAEQRVRWQFIGAGAKPVRLTIGSTPGSDDLYNKRYPAKAKAAIVKGLPLDGRPLYVSLTSAGSEPDAREFVAAHMPPPELSSPLAGEMLAGARARFEWTNHEHAVTGWELRITSEGASEAGDLFMRQFPAKTRAVSVRGLPEDGQALTVTLVARRPGGDTSTDTVVRAAIPAPSLVREGDSTFGWSADGGADGYHLRVGTVPGGNDLCDSGPLASAILSFTCPSLPNDGREIFAKLYRTVGSVVSEHALDLALDLPRPEIVYPVPDSTLEGHTVTFALERNTRPVSTWELHLGTRQGRADLFRARLPGDAIDVEVPRLPTQGGDVFARLFYTINGKRRFHDLRFDAADFPMPVLMRPGDGNNLDGSPLTFEWRDSAHDITSWRLDLGTSPGAKDFGSYRSDAPNDAQHSTHGSQTYSSLAVAGLPADTTIYARLSYRVDRDMREHQIDRTLSPTTAACCALDFGSTLAENTGGVDGLADPQTFVISPDGRHIYVATRGASLALLERQHDPSAPAFGALHFVGPQPVVANAAQALMNVDGTRLYVLGRDEIGVYSRDAASGALGELQTVPANRSFRFALAPGGSHIYAVGNVVTEVFEVSPTDGSLALDQQLLHGTDHSLMRSGRRVLVVPAGGDLVDIYISGTSQDSDGDPAYGALAVFRHDRTAGTVTPVQGLREDLDGTLAPNEAEGLRGASGMTASSDGHFVYVHGDASPNYSLVVLSRDPTTGMLTPLPDLLREQLIYGYGGSELVVAADGMRLYAANRGAGGITVHVRDPVSGRVGGEDGQFVFYRLELESEGTGTPVSILRSPDGEHLYLLRNAAPSGGIGAGVSAYAMNPASDAPDALVFIDEVSNGDGGVDGLASTSEMAAGPGGRHVYVVGGEHKVAVVARDLATDELSVTQVLEFDPDTELSGLFDPRSVVLSPDSAFVYVSGRQYHEPREAGVTVFARAPADGTLTFVQFAPFPRNQAGHADVSPYIALGPDGRQVYATGELTKQIALFERDPTSGQLSLIRSYEQGVDLDEGLDAPENVYVSPNGKNVYVLNPTTPAITVFSRDRSGELRLRQVVRGTAGDVPELQGPFALALSHDDADLYVMARSNSSVIHFRRARKDGRLDFAHRYELAPGAGVGTLEALAFDPTGGILYLGSAHGSVTFSRSSATGALVQGASLHDLAARRLAFVSDTAHAPVFYWSGDVLGSAHYHHRLVSPAGATLQSQSVEFAWNANGIPALGWRLVAGSTPGARDLCDSRKLARSTRRYTCRGLPREGEAVFVTLVAMFSGTEQPRVWKYDAATLPLPTITSPTPGDAVAGTHTFSLDRLGNDISQWRIRAGIRPGGSDLGTRKLGGDATEFTFANLPTDRPFYISVESRGTYGRNTRVYEYNPAPEVTAFYPNHGRAWGSYMRAGADVHSGSDRECKPTQSGARQACLHAGERVQFVVPGVLSCDGVNASDDLGVFTWQCSDHMLPVRVLSTGLAPGMGLADLIDFPAAGLRPNRVTVNHGGVSQSVSGVWWPNPVETLDDGGPVSSGTIALARNHSPAQPFVLNRTRGASLVVAPGITVQAPSAGARALVEMNDTAFGWVEGSFDGARASFGVRMSKGAWNTLRRVTVDGVDVLDGEDFARVRSAGVAMERARNSRLGEVRVDGGEAGVALHRVNGSLLEDVAASGAAVGVFLTRSNTNQLRHLTVANNAEEGLTFDERSIGNVASTIAASGNRAHGVVVAGRSDGNHLFGVLSRNNGASGVLFEDVLGSVLMGATALENAGVGVDLVGARRSALFALAVGGNGLEGVRFDSASDNYVRSLASAHNAGTGISLLNGSVRNRFAGELRFGDNLGAGDCLTDATSSGLETSCALPDPASGHVRGDATLLTAFVGAVSTDDLTNTSDVAGMREFDQIDDWTRFENPWRAWARAGDLDTGAPGACLAADTCQIDDARLRTGDTGMAGGPALANAVATGGGVETLVRLRLRSPVRLLPGAEELLGDQVGDDDGLCEPGEACRAMPHLGAFQGQGPLVPLAADGIELGIHATELITPTP